MTKSGILLLVLILSACAGKQVRYDDNTINGMLIGAWVKTKKLSEGRFYSETLYIPDGRYEIRAIVNIEGQDVQSWMEGSWKQSSGELETKSSKCSKGGFFKCPSEKTVELIFVDRNNIDYRQKDGSRVQTKRTKMPSLFGFDEMEALQN